MDKQELRENFDHFDTDGNGHIDREEFERLMDVLGAELGADELEVGFTAIDADGNGTIEFDEFADWFSDRG